jgi:hypothetical protein
MRNIRTNSVRSVRRTRQHAWQKSISFEQPISPHLGPIRKIKTLRDVAALILALEIDHQRKPVWERTAAMARRASATRKLADLAAARLQLIRALVSEQWL